MSNVRKFEELLRSDETLQEKLRAATEAWEGSRDDERAVFEAVVAPLAEEVGLPFSFEEAVEFAKGDQALSLDDLDEAAGGFCLAVGVSEGLGACAKMKSTGATACGGIGVGFMWTS